MRGRDYAAVGAQQVEHNRIVLGWADGLALAHGLRLSLPMVPAMTAQDMGRRVSRDRVPTAPFRWPAKRDHTSA